ncbi:GvpL/GvpF family gas vesicle protein [Micromonospora sp. WMMD1120]|uniref:GvpL/GvpF family gas vesicle protein n=1 Tax=Micromonospora sp. WMMD1120 TaxID=3016106 RepID=UPI00241627C3|nr:GvpL/GvpF family gas vesicle protein [Micromonospora sp. WMMD1120]MDG4806520.1 GvpL/GvpF family gas vesicle protein [Micromonospora sp. WMMD1120]
MVESEPPNPAVGAWLHGVVPEAGPAGHGDGAFGPAALAGIVGMDGGRVRAVSAAGLVAVVSAAPLAEYGEQALRRNLEDLAWLERAARAHHAVVAALARRGPVVPARLATVHTDDERVARSLTARRAELLATLDRLTGRGEWGVKGYLVPGAPAVDPEPVGAGGVGTAYLRRRRAQLTAREQGHRSADAAAEAVHDALCQVAVSGRRHAPQDRRLSGASAPMVLNGAYLVDVSALPRFTELVGSLGGRHPGLRLELTGPWPAYSFVTDRPEPALTVRQPA